MKAVDTGERQVAISGTTQKAKMSIHADSRMFKNLLSSIYSEKEKTVIRELMANAFDAHVEAGCPEREIEVHLPTALDPTLIVRDYGVGMSHDFMMNLYSAVGFSTKQQDNKQTGMFGVGSKSPMAITDSFIVKAYDADGIRQYMIVIPQDDHPEINFTFHTRDQDKKYERGIEVIVPIDVSRRNAVLDGLATQHFCWFDKPVKFLGAIGEVKHRFYTSINKIADGVYIAAPAKGSTTVNATKSKWNVFVRQGAAVYPLIETQVDTKLDQRVRSMIENLCSNGRHLLIDLPIGTANVTMAREAIQYDKESTANIIKVLNQRCKAFKECLVQVVGDAKDYATATKRIAAAFNPDKRETLVSQMMAASLMNLVDDIIAANHSEWWKKQPDVDELDKETGLPTGKKVRPLYVRPSRGVRLMRHDFPEGKVLLHTGSFHHDRQLISVIGGNEHSLNFYWPSVVFVIPSHLNNWKDRIRDYLSETYKDDILPQDRSDAVPMQIVRCALKSVPEVIATLKRSGIETKPVLVDDLPNVETDEVRKRNFSKTSVYPWRGSSWSEDKVEPDYSEPAYYVARIGIGSEVHLVDPNLPLKTVGKRKVKLTNYDFNNMVTLAKAAKLLDESLPIYRVTENQAQRICTIAKKWIHLPTHVAKQIDKAQTHSVNLTIGHSDLIDAYDRFTRNAVAALKTVSQSPSDPTHPISCGRLIELVDRMCREDAVFELIIACRYVNDADGKVFRSGHEDNKLRNYLFEAVDKVDHTTVAKYNELVNAYKLKYKFFMKFVDEYGEWPTHAEAYLDGMQKVWHKKPSVKVTDYPELETFRDQFRVKLQSVLSQYHRAVQDRTKSSIGDHMLVGVKNVA